MSDIADERSMKVAMLSMHCESDHEEINILVKENRDLLNHEKQTHEELGAILGTDDNLRECATRMRDELKYQKELVESLGVEILALRRGLWNFLPDDEEEHRRIPHGEIDPEECAMCIAFDILKTPNSLGEE